MTDSEVRAPSHPHTYEQVSTGELLYVSVASRSRVKLYAKKKKKKQSREPRNGCSLVLAFVRASYLAIAHVTHR